MNWNEDLEHVEKMTGVVHGILSHDGDTALVLLNTGVAVEVSATHLPVPGDTVVEGELSV